jgi:hypothetical protein
MATLAEFKARIAKEALQEIKPIHEISKENDIAPSQVSASKKELEGRIVELFKRKNTINDSAKKQDNLIAQLERKVGNYFLPPSPLQRRFQSPPAISKLLAAGAVLGRVDIGAVPRGIALGSGKAWVLNAVE